MRTVGIWGDTRGLTRLHLHGGVVSEEGPAGPVAPGPASERVKLG